MKYCHDYDQIPMIYNYRKQLIHKNSNRGVFDDDSDSLDNLESYKTVAKPEVPQKKTPLKFYPQTIMGRVEFLKHSS